MTNEEQKLREIEDILADIFTAGGESHEVGGQSFDQLKQSGYIDRKIFDLTALISEGYVSREEHNKVLQQRDELREMLVRFMNHFSDVRHDWKGLYADAEAAIKNTETK